MPSSTRFWSSARPGRFAVSLQECQSEFASVRLISNEIVLMSRRLLVTAALPYANGPIHIGHLVEYEDVHPGGILALSFSRAAVGDLYWQMVRRTVAA